MEFQTASGPQGEGGAGPQFTPVFFLCCPKPSSLPLSVYRPGGNDPQAHPLQGPLSAATPAVLYRLRSVGASGQAFCASAHSTALKYKDQV